jgi:uncharacterized protein DUF6675
MNRHSLVWRALAVAAIFFLLPAVRPIQLRDGSQLSIRTFHAAPSIAAAPQSGPEPPCGREPVPSYPALDQPAAVKAWTESEVGRDWKPPGCTGWTSTGFTTLVTIVARFPYTSAAEDMLRHIRAISELAGVRYWSTTHKRWQTFILDAHALTGVQSGQRRKDFAPEEMKAGAELYFEQTDNISGKIIYRLHVLEASGNRIVFDVENATTVRHLLVPFFHPGDMQSIYFLDRESDRVWRYYSIVRTGKNASRHIAGSESSEINRAVAFYRHLVGIPTDQEPPAAR